MTRATVGGKAQIVVGDATSHGGRVVSGSPSSTWGHAEIPIARKGDKVTCPVCDPHVFEIAEGCDDSLDFGAPVALEGHKTICGAVLMWWKSPGVALSTPCGSGSDANPR